VFGGAFGGSGMQGFFEDVETVMVVLRKRVLNMLYIWTASRLCPLGVSTFVDFLNLLAVPPV
jgi:uncharacterized membrane protein